MALGTDDVSDDRAKGSYGDFEWILHYRYTTTCFPGGGPKRDKYLRRQELRGGASAKNSLVNIVMIVELEFPSGDILIIHSSSDQYCYDLAALPPDLSRFVWLLSPPTFLPQKEIKLPNGSLYLLELLSIIWRTAGFRCSENPTEVIMTVYYTSYRVFATCTIAAFRRTSYYRSNPSSILYSRYM